LRHQQHAGASAETGVVHLAVFIGGVFSEIHKVDLQGTRIARALDNAVVKRREHFGEQGQDVDLHTLASIYWAQHIDKSFEIWCIPVIEKGEKL